ncbi:unnamed protein product [Symbiodinium sp. KB8]|nr:unnamed protein product [Symbiodinium sp. KB8]
MPSAPSVQSLPAPPSKPAVAHKEATSSAPPEANPDKAVLQQLVAALGAHAEALPEDVRDILARQGRAEVQDHTKTLHKTVSAQALAKKELQKVRQTRTAFLASWNGYIKDLTALVQEQVQEQGKTLTELDDQETMWAGRLQDATAHLAKLAGEEVKPETMDIDEAEAAESRVAEAIATEQEMLQRRTQQQQASFNLLEALQSAKEKAAMDMEADKNTKPRAASRTPRRGAQPPLDVLSSAEESVQEAQALLLQHEVSGSWQLSSRETWDLRIDDDKIMSVHGCIVAAVRINDEALVLPVFNQPRLRYHRPVDGFTDMLGTAKDADSGHRFTVFDVTFHHRSRQRGPHWTLMDCIADAVANAGGRTKTVQVIERPMPALPGPQITLTAVGAGQGYHALPLDLRAFGFDVYTFTAAPGHSVEDAFEQLSTSRPGRRSLLSTGLVPAHFVFLDSAGARVDRLLDPVTQHEWVCLTPRRADGEAPPLATTDDAVAVAPTGPCNSAAAPPSSEHTFGSLLSPALIPSLPLHHEPQEKAPATAQRPHLTVPLSSMAGPLGLYDLCKDEGYHSHSFQPRWTYEASACLEMPFAAQSQQKQPAASSAMSTWKSIPDTALIVFVCLRLRRLYLTLIGPPELPPSGPPFDPDGDSEPPSLLSMHSGPRPSLLAKAGIEGLQILPESLGSHGRLTLNAEQLRLCNAVAPGDPASGYYTIFDRLRHSTVRKSRPDWTAADYLADAIQSYPEAVACVQFLQPPLPDLPLPQLTLTPPGLGHGVLAVAVDMRRLQGHVCTVIVAPGCDKAEVFDALASACPEHAMTLSFLVAQDAVFLQDATGVVCEAMPFRLDVLQWLSLQIDATGPLQQAMQATVPAPLFASTTGTTTFALPASSATTVQTVSFVLVGGGTIIRLAPQPWNAASVTDSLTEMLYVLALQGRMPERPQLQLAAATPKLPARHNTYMICFLVYPEGPDIHILQDHSVDGSLLQGFSVDAGTRPVHMLSDAHARRGYAAYLNGLAHTSANRELATGDLVQIRQGDYFAEAVPPGRLYHLLPDLRFFALSVPVPAMQALAADPLSATLQVRAREALLNTLRLRVADRRQHFGSPSQGGQPIIVLGPGHPALHLQMDQALTPGFQEAVNFLIDGEYLPAGTSFADPLVLEWTTPVFISIPPGSNRRTMLFPSPHFVNYLQVSVPPRLPIEGIPLPVRRGYVAVFPPNTASDHVIEERRESPTRRPSSASNAGTSLLQLHASLIRPSVPTPFGRRQLGKPILAAKASLELASAACFEAPREQPENASRQPPHAESVAIKPSPKPLCLDTLLPDASFRREPGRLLLGAEADMFDFLLSHYGLHSLRQDWDDIPGIKNSTRAFLSKLPHLPAGIQPDAMQYYVDGSFFESTRESGWAIVALALHQGIWKWAGYAATPADLHGDHCTLGASVSSAFETELAAMAYTLAMCLSVPVPSMIGYDSTSAHGVADAASFDHTETHLAQACRSLSHLLLLQQRRPSWLHIKSHSDHPMNGLADAVAKAAAKRVAFTSVAPALHEAQQSSALAWMWASLRLHPSVPGPLPNGALPDAAQVDHTAPDVTQLRPAAISVPAELKFAFRAVTYNCLTAQSIAQQESLCKQFVAHDVHVIGLQETRVDRNGRSSNAHYHVLSSPAHEGQCGCQLRLAKTMPVASAAGQKIGWDSTSLCLIHAEPRLLLAVAKVGSQTLAFIVGHSPTTKAGPAACHNWWRSLSQAVRRLPCNSVPLFFLDANAHNHDPTVHSCEVKGVNANQKGLADLVHDHHLRASGYVAADGRAFHSWHGPGGQKACIDYICCPQSLSAGMIVEGPIPGFVGHVSHDHRPVAVAFNWVRQGSHTPKTRRINADVLRTPAGQSALKQLYNTVPPIPWEASVDTHLQILNTHLQQGLQVICPRIADKARDPVTSAETWQLIKDRRRLRRDIHRVSAPAEWQEYQALLGEQIKDLTRRIRQSARSDAAHAMRVSFDSARKKGVDALHRLCRQISKAGRRYRAPNLCPALRQADGSVAEDSLRILGDHFAEAERAHKVEVQEISTRPISYAQADFEVADGLSVAGLARAFSGLTTRRAAGWTTLPAEAYQAAPLEAAHHHVAVVLKCQLRKQCPIAWRGGLAAAIPKPNKPPHTTSGWRSILLLESGAKGVAKALRRDLLLAFDSVRQPAQGGSRPGAPMQTASAQVRGLIHRLRSRKLSGGILFVDGQAAFYSMLRESLVGTDACQPQQFFQKLAEDAFDDENDRLQFLLHTLGPGLLEQAAVPEAIRRFVAACLDSTWFCIGSSPMHFYCTRSGTVPGAPLADLMFQLVFSKVLARISAEAEDAAILSWHPGRSTEACLPLPAPSWMDDVAFPVISADPAALLQQASQLVTIVDGAFHQAGVRINFARGKTEFLPILHGRHSQTFKRRWLCQQEPCFRAEARSGAVTVHMSAQYTHLGTEVDATGSDLADLRRRRSLARDMSKALARLLRNPCLERHEKVNMIVAMPLARLRHGSGLWMLQTDQEKRLYRHAYVEPLRRAFRAVCGFSSRGIDDNSIFRCFGVMMPEQARVVDLLRHAGWILSDGSPILRDMWFDDGRWHCEVLRAIDECRRVLGEATTCTWESISTQPATATQWARRYSKKCRALALAQQDVTCTAWSNFAKARDLGAIFYHYDGDAAVAADHPCPECNAVCRTAAALASHRRKIHGQQARASVVAQGTRCEACGTEYWSTSRLREHLRRQEHCLRVWEEADIVGTDYVKPESTFAWKPACKAFGPAPWWASMRPDSSTSPALPHTELSQDLVRDWLSAASSELAEGQVCQLVEKGIRSSLCPEDLPVAALSLRPLYHLTGSAAQTSFLGMDIPISLTRQGPYSPPRPTSTRFPNSTLLPFFFLGSLI